MIYEQLINHKLFKFIQIGNRTALVVRSADAVSYTHLTLPTTPYV